MTVTKRKVVRPQAEERVANQDTGVQYSCDVCAADISHTVRIRCAQQHAADNSDASNEAGPLSKSSLPNGQPPLKKRKTSRSPERDANQAAEESNTKMISTCEDFDLCGSCFIEGKEIGRHKRWHDYRVVEPHAYPIFCNDWGADEELLLIDACQTYGLGNWADIADHIGSYRTKEEVQEHYHKVFLESPNFPLPQIARDLTTSQQKFQSIKKARLEAAQARPLPMPPPKPAASVPLCHEVGGFMPARLEFEHEFENDAETLVKDIDFGLVMRYGGDLQPASLEIAMAASRDNSIEPLVKMEPDLEHPASITQTTIQKPKTDAKKDEATTAADELLEEDEDELDLKLTMLDMYNTKYDKRLECKELILDRNLVEYKKLLIQDKRRSKEERDVVNRAKVFARLHSAADHEALVDGLLYEITLRKRISELQEYRRAGLVSLGEVDKYEREKVVRNANRANNVQLGRLAKSNLAERRPTDSREGTPKPARRIPQIPQTLANSPALHLLTPAERFLCSRLGVFPKPFLFIKQTILREFARREGRLQRKDARSMFRADGDKISAIYDFLVGENMLSAVNTEPTDEVAVDEEVSSEFEAIDVDMKANGVDNTADDVQ